MNIQNPTPKITVRNLALFTVIVLAIGWIGRGLDLLTNKPSSEGPGILLWIVTPLAVSLLLRAIAGDGWKDWGIKPNFKGNAAWYVAAFLLYPVSTTCILIIGRSFGLITFPDSSSGALALTLQAFALGMPPNFIKNFFEESAWRGYLAPKVYSLRLNDFAGHSIVGLIWGAWHIPYYLFFLDRALLRNFTTLNLAVFILLAIVVMISWAMAYGEILLATKSIWPAVLMHAVEDSLLIPLFIDHRIQIRPGTDWLISPMSGLISVIFFLTISIGFRQLRLRTI